MTVQLSTLRVTAEMDAAKYVAGANQKAAADRAMVASGQGVAAAATQNDQKLSQSGDVLARLSRGYVDGYRNAERFEQGLRSLNRGLDTGKISMSQAEAILVGMNQKLGVAANSAELAARGQTQLAAAVAAANNQIEQQRVVMDRTTTSATRMHSANDNSSFRRQNLTYQLFDVGTSLSGGMNPALIAAQQGPQILQLYAGQGGIRAAISDSLGLALRLTRAMGPFAVAAGAGALAISNMRDEIEATTGKAVTFGQVAGAVLKTIASDIYGLVEPAVDAIAPWFELAWDKVSAGAIYAGNTIINSFHAAYEDVKYVWGQFPNMIGTLVISGLNVVVGGIENMVQTGADYIDAFIAKINIALAKISEVTGVSLSQIPTIGDLGLGVPIQDPFAAPLADATADRNRRIGEIMGSDPLGDYYRSVRERAQGSLTSGKGEGADPWANLRKEDTDALKRYRDAIKAADDAVKQNRDTFRGFLGDLKEGIMAGQKLGDVLKNAFGNLANTLADRALDNLADMIFPNSKSGGGAGPLGILGSLFGGGKFGTPSGFADMLGGAANDNRSTATGSIADYIRQAASARGIDPDIALRVARSEGGLTNPFRQGEAMLSYGREESYGPFQLHMRQGGVGARALQAGIDPRTNWQGGVDYGLDEAANKGWGQWFGAAKAGIGNREGLEGARAIGQLSDAATKAASGLGALDTGIAGAVKTLTGGAAGGATGGLGGLFGLGLSNIGAGFNPTPSGFADMLGMPSGGASSGGGGILGMLLGFLPKLFGFADGTENAPPGLAWVGERGPELLRFRGGEQVIPNHKLGGSSTFAPVFHIDARGSTMTTAQFEAIAKRQSKQALAEYDEQQRRGGQAAASKRYGALRA